MKKYQLTQEDIESYEQGRTIASIARIHDVDTRLIKKLLKEKEIETRKSGYRHDIKFESLSVKILPEDVVDYERGKSADYIAQKKGTTTATISLHWSKV